ncbi:MAG: hypothetical protein ACREHC_06075 [Candidatus Levyibacteriota bacterium]
MNKQKVNIFFDRAIALEEAEELLEISEKLFQAKLQTLEYKLKYAVTDQEKELLHHQAKILQRDYQKSLHDIEDFVLDVCLGRK